MAKHDHNYYDMFSYDFPCFSNKNSRISYVPQSMHFRWACTHCQPKRLPGNTNDQRCYDLGFIVNGTVTNKSRRSLITVVQLFSKHVRCINAIAGDL